MIGRSSPRTQTLTVDQQVEAVFRHPALYAVAAVAPGRAPVGRPAQHPTWLLLAYAVLARVYRSGARVENELAQRHVWQRVHRVVAETAERHPELDISPPGRIPPNWDAYKHARNRRFTAPDVLSDLQNTFTVCAVAQARSMGLLDPAGPGSLCHPARSRTVYGDGTVIRPLYRPPTARRETDRATGRSRVVYLDGAGNQIDAPQRRFDPDAADHHGHTGPVHGQNFVALYARGDAPHQRIVLGVDRVPAPGQEAATAVSAIKRLHAVAGSGIQAIVYDGAMRGVHIDEIMTSLGVVVINKVHGNARTGRRRGATRPERWHALGTWHHPTAAGSCQHAVAAVDGAVCEIGLDEGGTPIVLSRLARRQVKRPRRSSGRYHFNVAYEMPCPDGPFLAWVTPHALAGDADHSRADATRIIAEGEDDFARLYPLRSDAESFNSSLKRTLLVDRAMSLGGARQLLDVLAYGLLSNAAAGHYARESGNGIVRSRPAA